MNVFLSFDSRHNNHKVKYKIVDVYIKIIIYCIGPVGNIQKYIIHEDIFNGVVLTK